MSNQGGSSSQHNYYANVNNIATLNTMGFDDESDLVVHFQSMFVANEIYGITNPIPLHDTMMLPDLETMIVKKP